MAPGLLSEVAVHSAPSSDSKPQSVRREPLKLSGALDKFAPEDTTPLIGREFLNVNIVDDLLNATDADELLRDLAITSKSSLRVVVDVAQKANSGQSLNEVWSSFVPRRISRMPSRRISTTGWAC